MSKRIKTCDEFVAALQRVRFARDRLTDLLGDVDTAMPLRAYGLWKVLLHLLHDAIARRDWSSVAELLWLYDFAELAGKRGEMWEASYVSFLEDVKLPRDRADLRSFWRVCPPVFLRDIEDDRGVGRAR